MTKEEREELERRAAEISAQHKILPYVPDVPLPSAPPVPPPQKVIVVKSSSTFLAICWVVQIIACCVAVLIFLGTIFLPAPQAAAGMGAACAVVIIPYVFTRAVEYFSEQ